MLIRILFAMTNQSLYLPQYTLDQLSEQVCMKLPYFRNFFTTAKMWEGIPELCQRIEEEPRAVNSVIAEAKLQNKQLYSNPVVCTYHMILTRVYILLFYRHSHDNLYDQVVFTELAKTMGIYAGDCLSNTIQPPINRIIELDQMVEKAQREKKSAIKPVFEYVSHSEIESDHLCIEYNEEKLFRTMSNVIQDLIDRFETDLDVANVWFNAKQVVHTLRDIKRPELLIERAVTALDPKPGYYDREGGQIIMLCVYMMVLSSMHHNHFDTFLCKMESYAFNRDTDMRVFKIVQSIKKKIDENGPFDDYDYIGDVPVKAETFTREDMEVALADYKNTIQRINETSANKDAEIARLNEELQRAHEQLKAAEQEAQESKANNPDTTHLEAELKNAKDDFDQMVIELLTPICKKDEAAAKKFLNLVRLHSTDTDITGLANEWVKDNKISQKLKKERLWQVLHAARIYTSSDTNWNKQLGASDPMMVH